MSVSPAGGGFALRDPVFKSARKGKSGCGQWGPEILKRSYLRCLFLSACADRFAGV
jgi:hypothetical protein